MRAWATMFEQFLSSRGVEAPYTEADYFEPVSYTHLTLPTILRV